MIGILVVLWLGAWSALGTYNSLVSLDEGVKTAWAQVENQYQRRLDLIPNLVNTVKGFAAQEKDVLESVVQARASASKPVVNINDAQQIAQFQEAQAWLSSALSRLLVTVEAYPELKSNQLFASLQVDLAGTENRISTERMRYNDTVKNFNLVVRRFPASLFAGMFGFTVKTPFDAVEGADKAPTVDFAK